MYADGEGADTLRSGQLILGGWPTPGLGIASHVDSYWPRYGWQGTGAAVAYEWEAIPAGGWLAGSFVAGANYTALWAEFWAVCRGASNDLTVSVYTNVAGAPGVLVATAIFMRAAKVDDGDILGWQRAGFSIGTAALTSGTTYWLRFSGDDWQILTEGGVTSGATMRSSSGGAMQNNLIFRLRESLGVQCRAIFGELKGQLYCALAYDTGVASKVFMNGEAGVASGGSTTTLVDGGKAWITDIWKGCIVRITEGAGADQYATITSNTGTTLNFAAMSVAVAANSEYVILCSDRWYEVTGHGMAGVCTDVLAGNNILYFAMGSGETLKRLRVYNNAGTWTREWVAEAGNYADYLAQVGQLVWKGLRRASTMAVATAIDGSGTAAVSNLTFGTAILVGRIGEKITGLQIYGDTATCWVIKEGSVHQMEYVSGAWGSSMMPLYELAAAADERNGAGHVAHNVYLYFSLHDGLQRFYSGSLDNMGPDTGEGMPDWRRGAVAHLVGYPGRVYAVVDAGVGGTSSVLAWNGSGWCEVFRAPAQGDRMRRAYIQTIPGRAVDRMWMSMGGEVVWMPVDINPWQFDNSVAWNFYCYRPEGHVTSGWLHMGLMQAEKYWNKVQVRADNLGTGAGHVMIDGRIETDASWEAQSNYTRLSDTDPEKSIGRGSTALAWRVKLQTDSNKETPRVEAVVVESVTRLGHKWSENLVFRLADWEQNLRGEVEPAQNVSARWALIDAWCSSATPVTMRSELSVLDNRSVFLEAGTLQIIATDKDERGREVWVGQVQAVEV